MGERYVFIDRDGVLNKDPGGWTEHGYVTRWEDMHILPGVREAVDLFHRSGYRVVVISNQQGVGKGYFSEEDLACLSERVSDALMTPSGRIEDFYYCTHLKEERCACRKPESGLFDVAREDLGIRDAGDMYYIGDTLSDVRAGRGAGLRTVTVLSGKASREDVKGWEVKPDMVCRDLLEAARTILETGNARTFRKDRGEK